MSYYKWNPCIQVVSDCEGLLIITERRCQRLWVNDCNNNINKFAAALNEGLSVSTLQQMPHVYHSIATCLEQERYLIKVDSQKLLDIKSPDCGYFFSTQPNATESLSKIRGSTVSILGLGGTGSVILQHLVALGVKKFIILDNDIVEADNFNRQFIYRPQDIGLHKTSCAKKYIRERCGDAIVIAINRKITDAYDLIDLNIPSSNFIFNCMDHPVQEIEAAVYKYAEIKQIPAISCAVGLTLGHWGPLIIPEKTPTFEELTQSSRPCGSIPCTLSPQLAAPIRWSFGPTNTLISTLCVKDAISWLAGSDEIPSLGKRLTMDLCTYVVK